MTSRHAPPIIILSVVALAVSMVSLASAAPITSITDLNNFRVTRSLNDVGIPQGDRIQFGADVVPNGAAGTTMQGSQGGTTVPPATCLGLASDPNDCPRSVPFSDSLRGAWTLTFQNGTDTAAATTPDLSLLPSPPVPFPVSVTITGTGLQPTISFVVPAGFTPDAIRFVIFDKNARLSNGQADVIHSQGVPGSTRKFTFPSVLSSGRTLQMGGSYSLNLQLINTRRNDIPFNNGNAEILRTSSSFFAFSPRSDGGQAAFLPTVGPDGVYHFTIAAVEAGVVVFIDPLVAVGYDYATGPGDPNFQSVILPAVGDGTFTVRFIVNGVTVAQPVLAGQQFFFPSGGVAQFAVRGIPPSAGLDATNGTAFVTGVTFATNGSFTGIMTPITSEEAAVPTLSEWAQLGLVLILVGVAVWYLRRRQTLGAA